jgi:hypothetical protein
MREFGRKFYRSHILGMPSRDRATTIVVDLWTWLPILVRQIWSILLSNSTNVITYPLVQALLQVFYRHGR